MSLSMSKSLYNRIQKCFTKSEIHYLNAVPTVKIEMADFIIMSGTSNTGEGDAKTSKVEYCVKYHSYQHPP